jgi:hypothetical protein
MVKRIWMVQEDGVGAEQPKGLNDINKICVVALRGCDQLVCAGETLIITENQKLITC